MISMPTRDEVARLLWLQRSSESFDARLAAFPRSVDIVNIRADADAVLALFSAEPGVVSGQQRQCADVCDWCKHLEYCDGYAPGCPGHCTCPPKWFRETPESLALLEQERAEVAAAEASQDVQS